VHWRIAAAWHHEWFGRCGDVAALLDEALLLAGSDCVAAVALAQRAAAHTDEATSPLWRVPLLAGEPGATELDAARYGPRARISVALQAGSAPGGHRALPARLDGRSGDRRLALKSRATGRWLPGFWRRLSVGAPRRDLPVPKGVVAPGASPAAR
jgi:hypothetical protein